jgi:RNA polymerase sigma-70 factor, ECF subfamily
MVVRPPDPDHPHPDIDDALIQRIRAGDVTAFETVFRAYYEALRRFAFGYTRALDTAEDLVQDVMLAVWRRHAEFALHVSPAAYLYAAVRNRALNAMEHDAVARRHADALSGGSATASAASDELLFASELERAAYMHVEALPDRIRDVYKLRRYEGLSHPEIAELLGISVQAVYMRMTRAVQALELALAPWIS